MVLAVSLLFLMKEEYQTAFLTVYSIAWFTDAIDGTIARLTKTQSDLGSKLDDIADTMLGAIMGISIFVWIGTDLFKFLPYAVPLMLIRIFNVFYTKKKYGKPYVIHTYGNKITSFIAFLLPITYIVFSRHTSINKYFFFYVVIIVGTLASLEECLIHISSDKYNYRKRSIFISLPDEDENIEESGNKKTV
jgi:phosphatidylglycerophosphate synthase